jgi:hypothetical protein
MSTPIENLKDQQSVSPLSNNVRQKKGLFVQGHTEYRRYMGRVLRGENEVGPAIPRRYSGAEAEGVLPAAVRAGEPCLGRRPRSARRALARRPADKQAGSDRTTEFGP